MDRGFQENAQDGNSRPDMLRKGRGEIPGCGRMGKPFVVYFLRPFL